MLPARLVLCSITNGVVTPHWFLPGDYPWLRTLLEEVVRFEGRSVTDLMRRLREAPPPGVSSRRAALAGHVVLHATKLRAHRFAVPPSRVRAAVFSASASAAVGCSRAQIVEHAARELGLDAAVVETLLLADQRGERRVAASTQAPLPSPAELATSINLSLASALVARASYVRIEIEGNTRALVRQAQLGRLITTILPARSHAEAGLVVLEISGPLALFRRTNMYGRALGSLLPYLPWSRRFRLHAQCQLRGQESTFVLCTGDPIPAAASNRAYDSVIEQRFAADFARLAPDWDLVREPRPIESSQGLVFPDFALVHRSDRTRPRWLLEIAGYWTPAYVRKKLARLSEITASGKAANFILCLDADRNCSADELPPGAVVLRYRRRVDAAAVLAQLERYS